MNTDETAASEQTAVSEETAASEAITASEETTPSEQTETTATAVPARKTIPVSWAIDVRAALLEEIRDAAALAASEFRHNRVELRGILLGCLARRTIVIENWIPLPCGHPHGSDVLLSDSDRDTLQRLLAAYQPRTAHSAGCIGWVVAHTRGDAPSEHDVSVFTEYFPEPWHALLVVSAAAGDVARAAVFVREKDGTVNPHRPYRKIEVQPANAPPAAGGVTEPAASLLALHQGFADAEPSPVSVADEPARPFLRFPPRWAALLGLAVLAAAIATLVFVAFPRRAETQPVDVALNETNHQLVIRWAVPRELLSGADFGSLQIRDGAVQRTLRLTRDDLNSGSVTWVRQSGDVRVDLTVWKHGQPTTGVAEFLGAVEQPQPRVDSSQLDQLQHENAVLREETVRADARAAAAENLVRIMKNRMAAQASGSVARR